MAKKPKDITVDPSTLDRLSRAVVLPDQRVPTPSRSVFDDLGGDLLRDWQSTLIREKGSATPENTIILDFFSDVALQNAAADEGLAERFPMPDGYEVSDDDVSYVLSALAIYEHVMVARDVAWRKSTPPALAKSGAVEIIDQVQVWRQPSVLPQLVVEFDWLRLALSAWTSSGRDRYSLLTRLGSASYAPTLSASGWIAYWLILEMLKTGSEEQLGRVINMLSSTLELEDRVALGHAFQARKHFGGDDRRSMVKSVESHYFDQNLLLLVTNFATAIAAAGKLGWVVLSGVRPTIDQANVTAVRRGREGGDLLRAYKISMDLTYYVPKPRNVREACEFRGSKSIASFRAVLNEWTLELKKGEGKAIERMKRDIELASRDLRSLGGYRQVSRLITYVSLLVSVAGALVGLPLGLLVAPFGIALRVKQDSLERATRWTMLGR